MTRSRRRATPSLLTRKASASHGPRSTLLLSRERLLALHRPPDRTPIIGPPGLDHSSGTRHARMPRKIRHVVLALLSPRPVARQRHGSDHLESVSPAGWDGTTPEHSAAAAPLLLRLEGTDRSLAVHAERAAEEALRLDLPVRVVAALDHLRDSMGLLSLRDLVPAMQAIRVSRPLNMLNAEPSPRHSCSMLISWCAPTVPCCRRRHRSWGRVLAALEVGGRRRGTPEGFLLLVVLLNSGGTEREERTPAEATGP